LFDLTPYIPVNGYQLIGRKPCLCVEDTIVSYRRGANGVHSASLSTTEELLDRKVEAPV
jgi:hypothetical protein